MSTPETPHSPAPSSPRWWKALSLRELFMTFPGPIFQKEVRTSGRKRSTYWTRGLYVALMLGVVTVVYLVATTGMITHDAVAGGPGAAQVMQSTQEVAPAVTQGTVWFQFFALTVLAAIGSSSAICDERRSGTLGALLTTPLKAWQIVMGKMLGSLVQLLVLLLAASPLLFAIRVFGGVTARTVGISVTMILLHAVLASTLAIFYSIRAKRGAGAFLSALVTLFLIQVGPTLLGWATDELLKEFGSSLRAVTGFEFVPPIWLIVTASPVSLAFALLSGDMGVPPGLPPSLVENVWLLNAAYLIFWIAVMFLLSSWVLRRVLSKEAAGGSPIKVAGLPKKKARVALPPGATPPTVVPLPGSAQDAAERINEFSRDVADNPVMWRELRQALFSKPWHLRLALGVYVALLTFLYTRAYREPEVLHIVLTIICAVLMVGIATICTTASISGERESRSWDALLSTPLTAWNIVTGKFLGSLRKQWFIPAALLGHLVIGGLVVGGLRWTWIFLLPVLLGPIVALAATGTLLSLVCRKSSWAAACNFGLAGVIYIIMPMSIAAIGAISNSYGFENTTQKVASATLLINPVAMAGLVITHAADSRHYGNTFDAFDLFTISAPLFGLLATAICTAYLAFAYLILKLAAAKLAADTGRER